MFECAELFLLLGSAFHVGGDIKLDKTSENVTVKGGTCKLLIQK